ncbi:MAG: extracellular solute-binding protein [Actinomycetales bacterium]|nr:extracellular solute-binding protein [Actinomycetales bacterium]
MTRPHRSAARLATVLTAAATLALAGCASAGDTGGSSSPGSDQSGSGTQEPVTIEASWWGDDARAALFGQVISDFEAKYPYITVKQTPVGSPDDLFNRLATDFGGGGETAPDLFALGGAKPQEYGSAGALLDLSTVADIAHVSDYPEFSLTSATVDGKVYGLPTGGNATAAFVNTDIFDKAGVTVPADGWTWDDLIKVAGEIGKKGLTNDQGKPIYGVDMRSADIIGTFAAQETQYGLYTPDGKLGVGTDTIAKFYTMEKDLQAAGGLPDPSIVTDGVALPPDQQLYTLGQAAVTFGYSNLIGTYSQGGTTKLMTPPTDTKTTGVSLLPSAFWSINAASKHPQEAAMLMNWFLTEPSALELIKDTRGVPFNPSAAAVVTPLLEGNSKDAAEYVQSILDSGTVAPPQPNGGGNMNKYTQDGEANVLFGQATPEQAAKTWVDQLSADLAAG